MRDMVNMAWVAQHSFNPAEAREAGITFYDLPVDLRKEQIDPLLCEIVARINASGWVATGESCQGHPDCVGYEPWCSNVRPMLRLVTRLDALGEMLSCLARAMAPSTEVLDHYGPQGFEVWVQQVKAPWASVTVYLSCNTTYSRNRALERFNVFSKLLLQVEV